MSRASSDVDKKHLQSLKKIQLKLYEELDTLCDGQSDGQTDGQTDALGGAASIRLDTIFDGQSDGRTDRRAHGEKQHVSRTWRGGGHNTHIQLFL